MQKRLFIWLLLIAPLLARAHPMPNSVVNLSVLENSVKGTAKIPYAELENATGNYKLDVTGQYSFLQQYFIKHITAKSSNENWNTTIDTLFLAEEKDPVVGTYKEIVVQFELVPAQNNNVRNFSFVYDAIVHQVVTHKVLVYVAQDWMNGLQHESNALEIGVIELNIPTGTINTLTINLAPGSWWKGFSSMLLLGMQHIKDGTDHLLFLLVLLLPATLNYSQKKWTGYAGVTTSLYKLIKIITAFTIGHSLTLITGALQWVKVASQPVEILIAISILVASVHAVYPLFAGREIYIAVFFGLIHGLAFASVLFNLSLPTGKLALSILGFNLGIELMQLIIIALVIPWLLLLSKTPVYKIFRQFGAAMAAVAAMAWVAERYSGNTNPVTEFIVKNNAAAPWALILLAIVAITCYWIYTAAEKKMAAGSTNDTF
jgi:hypothetical protein